MKKIIIICTLTLTLALAREIQFLEQDLCLIDYWNDGGQCTIKYYVDESEVKLSDNCNSYTFIEDTCTDNSRLALNKSDYNFLMALMANFLGFMLVFMVGFLFVLQGKK